MIVMQHSRPPSSVREYFEATSFLHGVNAAYIEELQDRFSKDPDSIDPQWQAFFRSLGDKGEIVAAAILGPAWKRRDWPPLANGELISAMDGNWPAPKSARAGETTAESQRGADDAIKALMMIHAYKTVGHFHATLDPLGLARPKTRKELLPETYGFHEADFDRSVHLCGAEGFDAITLGALIEHLKRTYCGSIGYEFMHISDTEQRAWIDQCIEQPTSLSHDEKRELLQKLIEVKGYERYLDKKFVGTKRFGLDGAESAICAIEETLKLGARHGVRDVVIGMAHRGRLNVLSQVLRKPHRAIFSEFKGGSAIPDNIENSGDVKYHLGASADREIEGHAVHLSLAANPSHLEISDPVVLGKARAKQDQNEDAVARTSVLPLLIHGDAAFAGQGVVAECFALSGLKGYRTGGSIHLIINNQIGFTTDPSYSRSSAYPSDLAKVVEAPVFHVNGDDPEAVVRVARLAMAFRQAFGKPVVIDLVSFRLYGHNEGDEPSFTQPLMYKEIRAHPSTLELYGAQLVAEDVIDQPAIEQRKADWSARLDSEFEASQTYESDKADWLEGEWAGLKAASDADDGNIAGVDRTRLQSLGERITMCPPAFACHPTVTRFLDARRNAIRAGEGIDWATAEALAIATLVDAGIPVRLSGQDSERGTFSQRHSVIADQNTGERYSPLSRLRDGRARCEIINSPLSEEAVLAFEYGYSLAEPNTLVMWEAQFGDFANGAQVVFDQFLSSGARKWLRMSGLVCLLPHGYDGQGPEHSSARLERFLQNSAEDNWVVANCTTPANYFHILRRQVLRSFRRPLILMTPKSLLRNKRCRSALSEMDTGTSFRSVLVDDAEVNSGETHKLVSDARIRRVILCTGKVFYDLAEAREARRVDDVYLMRIEQLYPVPFEAITKALVRFPNAEVVWCQEEPRNMGAWAFIGPHLENALGTIDHAAVRVRYVGRPAAASPAVGTMAKHNAQLAAFLQQAFAP